MALIRLRGLCEAGNVCLTSSATPTPATLCCKAHSIPPQPQPLNAPDGEGVIRIPAEQVATMLFGLGPDTGTDTPGREVLA